MSRDEIIAMGNEAALQHGHTYDAERLEWLGKLDQHLEGLAGSHTQ